MSRLEWSHSWGWNVLLANLYYTYVHIGALPICGIFMCRTCWNLLVASSAATRISDGRTRRFVYACYLDVDTVYNHSYIECTGTRLPRSPPTSCTLIGPASRISIVRPGSWRMKPSSSHTNKSGTPTHHKTRMTLVVKTHQNPYPYPLEPSHLVVGMGLSG